MESLEAEAARVSETEFIAHHPHPFLSFDAPEDDEDLHFMTELGNVPATRKQVVVAPITKRDQKSPFQDRISVGRARQSGCRCGSPGGAQVRGGLARGALRTDGAAGGRGGSRARRP